MRELAAALAAIVVALGIVGAVVFGARDASLFVPPPEAVAENFARELVSGRYQLARRQLSERERRQRGAADLKARFEAWRARIGPLNLAEAREVSRGSDGASAVCELQGERSAVVLTLSLVRQRGLWKVDGWEAAAEVTR